jgi:hypothetical protein
MSESSTHDAVHRSARPAFFWRRPLASGPSNMQPGRLVYAGGPWGREATTRHHGPAISSRQADWWTPPAGCAHRQEPPRRGLSVEAEWLSQRGAGAMARPQRLHQVVTCPAPSSVPSLPCSARSSSLLLPTSSGALPPEPHGLGHASPTHLLDHPPCPSPGFIECS